MRAALGLALALGAAWAQAAPAPTPATRAEVKQKIQGTRQDLKAIQEKLKLNQKELQTTVKQEKSLLGQLEQANRELESARSEAKAHVKNLGLVEDRLQRIQSRLEQLREEEAADRASLKRSLASLYKARARSGPALLFGARTPAELGARARYLGALSQGTERRIRSLQARQQQVHSFQDDYAARQAELKRQRAEAESARQLAESKRRQRQALLAGVRSKKARTQEAVRELERSFGRLQGFLGELQKEALRQAQARKAAGGRAPAPSALGGASTLRRGLAWPLRGRLLSNYGKQQHPVFKTPVFNRGIEIAAPHGSPVHAVAAGTVLHASAMEGFGELVVLDHGGGMMSVYGYGSKVHVSPGQGVAAGDLLAEVGEAGASHQPSLYFEIRQGAKALNPFTYLRRR